MNGALTRYGSEGLTVEEMEARIKEAEQKMADLLAQDIYGPAFIGPPLPQDPWRVRFARKLRWRWYAFREWLAVHVLRVEVASDEEW